MEDDNETMLLVLRHWVNTNRESMLSVQSGSYRVAFH